jgi:hypothetical protein
MRRHAEALERVEQEIRQAKAEALGRLGERLDQVLARLGELDRQLDAMDGAGPDAVRALAARNRWREEAARLAHYLVIQREAVGLRCHRAVTERYPVPPVRRPAATAGPAAPG